MEPRHRVVYLTGADLGYEGIEVMSATHSVASEGRVIVVQAQSSTDTWASTPQSTKSL